MVSNKKIVIRPFEPWMIDQIAELDVAEYGGDVEDKKVRYKHRLCSPYSAKYPPITLVGLSNKKVIATQLYFYWPYKKGNKTYRVFQSGDSQVHHDFRGQGLFRKLLSMGSTIGYQEKVDFFIGFPSPMSYGAFIKEGWIDIGNLRWWTKVLRPTKLAKQKRRKESYLQGNSQHIPVRVKDIFQDSDCLSKRFHMENSHDFLEWRYNQNSGKEYSRYEYNEGSVKMVFVYRVSVEHGFREILVGEIHFNVSDCVLFSKALSGFCGAIKKYVDITAISFALLSPSLSMIKGLIWNGFVPHKKAVPFIVKTISTMTPNNKNAWEISRGDIDTW